MIDLLVVGLVFSLYQGLRVVRPPRITRITLRIGRPPGRAAA